jgi:hypothetical protein
MLQQQFHVQMLDVELQSLRQPLPPIQDPFQRVPTGGGSCFPVMARVCSTKCAKELIVRGFLGKSAEPS